MKELPSVYQNFIYKRTYSRYIDEEQRRETFNESVDRYARFFDPRVPEKLKDEFKETIDMIKNLEVMPSMRALWVAGEALERDNISAYNCAFTTIERPKDFAEILYILMNGTGVGFSVERQFISKLPVVPEELEELEYTIVVEDSKLGWAEAYDELLNELYQGSIPQIDYSLIRPKGARLKTFGGRASGHEPLKQLFEFTIKTFKEARGRKLNSLECYDLATTVASIVIVGGVRRSATISLSNLSDRRMAGAKQGQFWVQHPNRTLSNNSVAYTEKPDMKAFMEEWLQLMKSGSGERGIINRVALQKSAEKTGRDPKADYGMNPCLIGSTELLTPEGYKPIETLVGNTTIINALGNPVESEVFYSGDKEVVKVSTYTPSVSFETTPDHRFLTVEGKELEAKDLKGRRLAPYLVEPKDLNETYVKLGFIQGDGNTGRLASRDHKGLEVNFSRKDGKVRELFGVEHTPRKVYLTEYTELLKEIGMSSKKLPERHLPYNWYSFYKKEKISFLRGLYSANGSVIGGTGRITLKSTCKFLVKQVQKELKELLDIDSYITSNKAKDVEFPNGSYSCKESYDLNIGNYKDRLTFYNSIGFIQRYKNEKLRDYLIKKAPKVRALVPQGVKPVYDFTEPETHWGVAEGFVVHNCGEVILKDDEFCNLTEVVIRPKDKHSDLVKKVQGATILGILQATLDDFKFINDNWKLNVQEERLLGVSLTGMRDHPLIGTVGVGASRELKELKEVVRTTAKKWAKALGINVPKAVTSVKPSGTVSQLVNASSGIHPRYAPYYIRRVRVAKEDPITQFLLDKGVPAHPEVGQTWENYSTVVFEFPLKSPEGSFCKDDEGAIEQLEYWKQVKLYWTEHNPSQTIYVSDDEWMEVGAWVYKNFDLIGGLSFLPRDGGVYELAPYEEINEEQYNELQSVLPDYIDWSELDAYEETDMTQGSREYACVAGACDL
jgi:ribonucleotide reductase alpha subunit